MSRSMGHLVTGLPAVCVLLESAAFRVRGPVRTSKLFGDGGGSESSDDDMDDFFRHLMGKDAMDPGWAETIVQHAKDDTSFGGQGHLPQPNSPWHSDSAAWRRVRSPCAQACVGGGTDNVRMVPCNRSMTPCTGG